MLVRRPGLTARFFPSPVFPGSVAVNGRQKNRPCGRWFAVQTRTSDACPYKQDGRWFDLSQLQQTGRFWSPWSTPMGTGATTTEKAERGAAPQPISIVVVPDHRHQPRAEKGIGLSCRKRKRVSSWESASLSGRVYSAGKRTGSSHDKKGDDIKKKKIKELSE